MNRITTREGKHTIRIGNRWRRDDPGWLKLADYEDTGLEPDNVKAMQSKSNAINPSCSGDHDNEKLTEVVLNNTDAQEVYDFIHDSKNINPTIIDESQANKRYSVECLKKQKIDLYTQEWTSDWYFMYPSIGYYKIDYLKEERITYSPDGTLIELFCKLQDNKLFKFLESVDKNQFSIVRCSEILNEQEEKYIRKERFCNAKYENYKESIKNTVANDYKTIRILITTNSKTYRDVIGFEEYKAMPVPELFENVNRLNSLSEHQREILNKLQDGLSRIE